MNRKLHVYMYGEVVGELTEGRDGHLDFEYTGVSYPLSVRMPVRGEKYGAEYAEPFFENIVPEGEVRAALARRFHFSERNIFSVLRELGGDCAGAVALYPGTRRPQLHRESIEISPTDLAHIIDDLPRYPLLTGLAHAPRLKLPHRQYRCPRKKLFVPARG